MSDLSKMRDLMRNDRELLRRHGIDESAIYPGHPVTLAFCIVHAFATYEEAFAPTEHNFTRAIGDVRIPGAGGCVSSALMILRHLKSGMPFDEAMTLADDYWATCDNQQAGGGLFAKDAEANARFHKRWHDGQVQADKIKPLLAEKKDWWK